jgi:hypothetical protein
VERDFARYLECGVLAHGFARVRCESCKDELLVAFSCKGRGVCPSCNAKRAHVTAVHLVERVLPRVPYLRALFALQRRRVRRQGLRDGQVGAVSFIQFFDSMFNAWFIEELNVGASGPRHAWPRLGREKLSPEAMQGVASGGPNPSQS